MATRKEARNVKEWFKNASSVVLSFVDSSEDADRAFSYYTRQQVMFLDWRLGSTFYLIQVGLVAFLLGYVLIYKEGYRRFEEAKGLTVTHVTGDAVATSSKAPGQRYFSTDELTFPGLENGNVMIATRQSIRTQTRGFCEDETMPCLTDADCTVGGQGHCSALGYCHERSWCNTQPQPESYEIDSDLLQIWVRPSIQFVKLAPEKVFTTDSDETPNDNYLFTVRELLRKCEPVPINYEEVAELGAVIDVTFRYDCNVKKDSCKPTVKVRRLDTKFDPDNIGYEFNHAEYIEEDRRMINKVRGLRFFFRTNGRGRKTSLSALITTVSTSGTLLSFAVVIADLLLSRGFPNSKKYRARKFATTPDFSEVMTQKEIQTKTKVSKTQIEKEEEAVIDREKAWMLKIEEEDV